MSAHDGVSGVADSARRGAWDAGGVVLLALGIGSIAVAVAVAVAGLIFGGGGVAFFPLAVPPLGRGLWGPSQGSAEHASSASSPRSPTPPRWLTSSRLPRAASLRRRVRALDRSTRVPCLSTWPSWWPRS